MSRELNCMWHFLHTGSMGISLSDCDNLSATNVIIILMLLLLLNYLVKCRLHQV